MSTLDARLRALTETKPAPAKAKAKKKPKKDRGTYTFDPTRLDDCSDSELVAIAHYIGHPQVSRGLSRDDIIDIILNDTPVPEGADVLRDVRAKLHAHVEGNRANINASLMSCDLQCLQCPHQLMVECFTVNQDLLE